MIKLKRWLTHQSIQRKLMLALITVASIGILIVSLSFLFSFERQFNQYLDQGREEAAEELLFVLAENDPTLIDQELHRQGMNGLFFKLEDPEGDVIFDSTQMNMMGNMNGRMRQQSDMMHNNLAEQLTEETLTVTLNNEPHQLTIYYPATYSAIELNFLEAMQSTLVIAIVVTIVLSILFSYLFVKPLTRNFRHLSAALSTLTTSKKAKAIDVEAFSNDLKPVAEAFNTLQLTLQQEAALRERFTGDLAHELRTPLATLQSQLEAIQDGVFEATPERMNQFHHELMRLVRLVNELEQLIQAENPQLSLKVTSFDVTVLFAEVTAQFETLLSQHQIEVIQTVTGDNHLSADRDKVQQMLTNLLMNAIKYSPKASTITLSYTTTSSRPIIAVTDQGPGIDQSHLPFITERFYRGDASRDRKSGGIGIGLSIVKALLERHNGELLIESASGSGTTVYLSFPSQQKQA